MRQECLIRCLVRSLRCFESNEEGNPAGYGWGPNVAAARAHVIAAAVARKEQDVAGGAGGERGREPEGGAGQRFSGGQRRKSTATVPSGLVR